MMLILPAVYVRLRKVLTKRDAQLMARLITQRFPEYQLPEGPTFAPQTPKETKIPEISQSRDHAAQAPQEVQCKPTSQTGKKQSGYVAGNERKGKPKGSLDYSKFDHIEDSDDEPCKH